MRRNHERKARNGAARASSRVNRGADAPTWSRATHLASHSSGRRCISLQRHRCASGVLGSLCRGDRGCGACGWRFDAAHAGELLRLDLRSADGVHRDGALRPVPRTLHSSEASQQERCATRVSDAGRAVGEIGMVVPNVVEATIVAQ
jgi:hypothetical protein